MLTIEQQVCHIVNSIVEDLADRRGLGGEWEQIDEDIKQEILEAWAKICLEALAPESPMNMESKRAGNC